MRRDGEANNLTLRGLSEIIGVLHDINYEGLVIKCAGRNIRIPAPPNLRRKAAKLVGKRVAILRIGQTVYIRKLKDSSSTDEESFTSEKSVELTLPRKVNHR